MRIPLTGSPPKVATGLTGLSIGIFCPTDALPTIGTNPFRGVPVPVVGGIEILLPPLEHFCPVGPAP
jgi:hypothetical protein